MLVDQMEEERVESRTGYMQLAVSMYYVIGSRTGVAWIADELIMSNRNLPPSATRPINN